MNPLFLPFASLAKFRAIGDDAFICCCPVHAEKTPSFRGKMHGSKLLLTCHGCHCSSRQVLAAMGLRWSDLFADSPRPPGEVRQARSRSAQFALWRERELVACATALRERDDVLRLDWSQYEGELTDEVLATACQGYGELEWRFDMLRCGTNEECKNLDAALRRKSGAG